MIKTVFGEKHALSATIYIYTRDENANRDFEEQYNNAKMNQYNVVFLLLIICGLADQTKSSESVLNCEQYTSDQDILNRLPFPILTEDTPYDEIGNVYSMDETGTFVTYLRLANTNATVPESIFCLKNLEHLLIINMNFINGKNHPVFSMNR